MAELSGNRKHEIETEAETIATNYEHWTPEEKFHLLRILAIEFDISHCINLEQITQWPNQ